MASTTLRKRLAVIFTISIFTIGLLYYWRFQYSPQDGEEMTPPKPVTPEKTPDHITPINNENEDLIKTTIPTPVHTAPAKPEEGSPIPSSSSTSTKMIPPSRPTVIIPQGTFIGKQTKNYPQPLEEFLGVPYALPPTGNQRFKPPIPIPTIPSSTPKIFDVSTPSPRCMTGPDSEPQSEDCLHLNIYRPIIKPSPNNSTQAKPKLPVLIHIHGGAFNFGYADDREIASLVGWSDEPILAITFEYRVGALGFLPSKLMAESEGGLLNLGLKDQRLLFEWVRENIGAFGGDVDNVTLMGPSAGAHSIGHHLMYNDGTAPLFNKVIIESGGPTARAIYSYNHPLHETQFSEFLSHLSLSEIPTTEILSKLRSLPVSEIKAASEAIFNTYDPSLRWPFQPCLDGPNGLIPRPPIQSLLNDTYHHIPILLGYNTNEGSLFVPPEVSTSESFLDFFHILLPTLTPDDLAILDPLYPDPELNHDSPYTFDHTAFEVGAQYQRLSQAYADFAYICPVKHLAHFATGEYTSSSSSSSSPSNTSTPSLSKPIYLYEFAPKSSKLHGAAHGDQYPFPVFSSEVTGESETIRDIAKAMHGYWTSFIVSKEGDPNLVMGKEEGRVKWERYFEEGRDGDDGRKKMVFGRGNDEMAGGGEKGVVVQMEVEEIGEACEFWWERVGLWEF